MSYESQRARASFWRNLFSRAWEHSKEHFVWMYPVGSLVITFVLASWLKGWDKAMDDLSTSLIAGGSAAVVAIVVYCVNVARSASSIYVEQLALVSKIEGERNALKEDSARAKASDEMSRHGSEEHGFEFEFSRMSFSWEDHPDIPPGVLVALDVERIVNGNSKDAVLDLKMVAPLWRNGPFAINTSCRPLLSAVGPVVARRPILPPLINLAGKQGIGPGYFLFFFSFKSWKEEIFIPDSDRQGTLEDFAKIIHAAELQVEFVDRANKVYIPPVLAPGTLSKRVERQQREIREARERQ